MHHIRTSFLVLALLLAAAFVPACGIGGSDAAGAGQGLVVLSFLQDGVDNAVLNTRLGFIFSEDVDGTTVTDASIQIREGPEFGKSVKGVFVTEGNTVFFEPALAGLCDLSDSGLKADTQYRVQLSGFPEEFSVRSMAGQPLRTTTTFEFHTRGDQDPALYEDQISGVGPSVLAAGVSPANGTQGAVVQVGNKIVLPISENIAPCSLNDTSVLFHMWQTGDAGVFAPTPNGTNSGFSSGGDTSDQTSGDPFTWGAPGTVPVSPPQKILASIKLVQGFHGTTIEIVPQAGRFPENALVVLQLTFGIRDYGNIPMTPYTLAFTTENLPLQQGSYVVENLGETPWNADLSTADINTTRAPGLIQGFMLFSGDGNNGGDQLTPSFPNGTICDSRVNAGAPDDFDPSGDVFLDTGGTPSACSNSTDGSTAVVWEFNTFHIRNGVTVRLIGVNPAIILVLGDAIIDGGGLLLVRGDGSGGSPRGAGRNGYNWVYQTSNITAGGVGVAGGGDGGDAIKMSTGDPGGDDGLSAFGSLDGLGVQGGEGAGEGGTHLDGTYSGDRGSAQGGGGGGHATAGGDATSVLGAGSLWRTTPTAGHGGSAFPTTAGADRMLTPSAGGGGGGGGNDEWDGSYKGLYSTGGGSGAAGGGFVDLTCGGNIVVNGTIDAAGGRGGDGGSTNYYTGPGGGGGGAGGGIRLLTANDIILGSTAVLTAVGGAGGLSKLGTSAGGAGPLNHGAVGSSGRIVLEDSDSVISGLSGATVVPGDGDEGFYRGLFDATRFQGGGLTPQAISDAFAVGPLNPSYAPPIQNYGVQEDFVAGTPVGTTIGAGKTAILIEAQGFQMKPNGTADTGSGTGWFTVGHFTDSGVENLPTWNLGQPTAGQLPTGLPGGNMGAGIHNLNLREFIQLRVTIYLPSTVLPTDPCSFLDHWTIRFTSDQ